MTERAGDGSPEGRVDERIRVGERYYILASSSRLDQRTAVLKDADTFAIFDRYGDMHPAGLGEQGLYHEGTRHLSRCELRLDGERPLLLSSTVREDNALLAVDLANPDLPGAGAAGAQSVHLFRATFLHAGVCYQRIRVRSYAPVPLRLRLALAFDADFADIFEVRGMRRAVRGETLAPWVEEGALVLRYRGLDGVERRTRIAAAGAAFRPDGEARVDLTLRPHAQAQFEITIACARDGVAAAPGEFAAVFAAAGAQRERTRAGEPSIETSNDRFDAWLRRSRADLAMMVTPTAHGAYPYAGVPWYSTVFGRDGIVTALELLWTNPGVARGVLSVLAAHQADTADPARDAEPGKILHEMRSGEMAALGEIPFGRYYGSVDATPLFVLLAGAYYERTADRAFAVRMLPHVERALAWLDQHGDVDGDGFVEYRRHAADGLAHQGWKDSPDAIFHADGAPVEGTIALCEVQGYVYGARLAAARLAAALGRPDLAARQAEEAERLRRRFEAAFWLEEEGTYALALDPAKRPCRVHSSNAGQVLFSGIAAPARARRVARAVLDDAMFSGWGVRTVAAGAARYNPMSYHNGSVWPHDNALIAAGLARYGFKDAVVRILGGLFDASIALELHRLPELFCGFPRRAGEGPTLYPVACAPQAWAVGAPFLVLQACLGLTVEAERRCVRLDRPVLPDFLDEVRITGLEVAADARVDLVLHRHPDGVAVRVARRSAGVEVVTVH